MAKFKLNLCWIKHTGLLIILAFTFAFCSAKKNVKLDAISSANDMEVQNDASSHEIITIGSEIENGDTTGQKQEIKFFGCNGSVDLSSVPERNFIVAPYLIKPKTDGITIKWEAMDNAPAYLLWGEGDKIKNCTCAPEPIQIPIDSEDVTGKDDGWLYSVTLTGLKTNQNYTYTLANAKVPKDDPVTGISMKAEWVDFKEAHFKTAPDINTDYKLVVYGDNQPLPMTLKTVIEQISKIGPDFVLHVGDIVHSGSIIAFRYYFFLVASPLMRIVPHLFLAGNHEGHGKKLPFDSFFPVPNNESITVNGKEIYPGPRTGYFDYGNARYFILDSEREMGEGSNQLIWLDAMLGQTVKQHPEIVWLFVAWHRPIFSESDTALIGPRVALHNVMKKWKVDVVWNGHHHLYEHFLQDDVVYIVTGGGGALLIDVDGGTKYPDDNRIAAESSFHVVSGTVGQTKCEFQAIRAKDSIHGKAGSVIDSFTVKAKDRSDLK